ncbi:zinc finger, CCHC-type containing protein [Tanacetum coccineum]
MSRAISLLLMKTEKELVPKDKLVGIGTSNVRIDAEENSNLDYAALIWDEFKLQITSRMKSQTKADKLPFLRFTKMIISCQTTTPSIRDHVNMYRGDMDKTYKPSKVIADNECSYDVSGHKGRVLGQKGKLGKELQSERGISSWYQSFSLIEVGFHYRLPKLKPLIDAYAISISSEECECLSIRSLNVHPSKCSKKASIAPRVGLVSSQQPLQEKHLKRRASGWTEIHPNIEQDPRISSVRDGNSRWQKKMYFLLSSMSVVYVLTTPLPKDGGDNPTMEQVRKRAKTMGFLGAKYMAEDASSKKFLVSNITNYKMTDSRPVMEQYNELLGILGRFTQHKMNMDEAIQVSCIIDKLPPSWKYFKHTLKYLKEELTLVELGSHLRIEESLRVHDNDKPNGNNVVGPSVVNIVEHNNFYKCGKTGHMKRDYKGVNVGNKANGSGTKGSVDGSSNSLKGHNMFNKSLQVYYVTYVSEAYFIQDDDVAWWFDSGAIVHVCKDRCWFKTYKLLNDGSILHMGNELTALVHGRGYVDLRFSSGKIDEALDKFKVFKTKVELQQGSLIKRFRTDMGVVRLPDPKLKTLGERGIECIFVGYAEHSKAFRFFVIDPNESVLIKSIIKFKDVVFDENRFSSVLRPRTRDDVSDQHSYCFNVEDDPKTFDEAMKSQDVTFWKEANNDEMDFIMGNNTWVLADLPLGCKPLGANGSSKENYSTIRLLIAMALIHGLIIHQMDVKTTFLNGELEEDVYMNQPQGFIMPGNENKSHYIEKVLKKFNYFECTPVSTPMDTSEKLMPNNGQAVSQLKYSRVIGCLMYVMTCIWLDISFAVGKLSRYTSNPGIQHWQAIQRVLKINSSTSDWVFLLDGGTTSWASKKQTCITGSTIESEFVALAAAGKESEWLKNFLIEIPLWSKPIAPTPIHCDSVATLAKAYSQMYNRKSRHLVVRHSMIRELIMNGVVSIEFVMSQQNLADHLTKGLARDLVIKSTEGMGLKMCLEPDEKEDAVVNFLMVNFFEKVLSRSMNKEEPPMTFSLIFMQRNCTKLGRIVGNLVQLWWAQFILDNGAGVGTLDKDIHQADGFSLVLPEELPKLRPLVDVYAVSISSEECECLSIVANSYTRPSYSHAIPSYSCSQQPYYVTYPTSLHDCDDHNKGEIQGDAQEDKLFTITMLLARSITQHFSTPRNNRLRTSSNTKNQVFIQDGHVDIQSKNGG